MRSLCLTVEQSYAEVPGAPLQPIAETVRRVLSACGFEVMAEGGPCQADLVISVEGRALKGEYSGGTKECYSGASVGGIVALSATERARLELPIAATREPPFVIHSCPEDPASAPFHLVWPIAVLESLTELWGQHVALHALGDEDKYIRAVAAGALGKLGPEASEAIPALTRALADPEAYVRQEVAKALGEIGPEAVPALILALKDESGGVREAAVKALGAIGPEAEEAVPALIRIMEQAEHDYQRRYPADALKAITGQDFGDDPAAWREWWERQG